MLDFSTFSAYVRARWVQHNQPPHRSTPRPAVVSANILPKALLLKYPVARHKWPEDLEDYYLKSGIMQPLTGVFNWFIAPLRSVPINSLHQTCRIQAQTWKWTPPPVRRCHRDGTAISPEVWLWWAPSGRFKPALQIISTRTLWQPGLD